MDIFTVMKIEGLDVDVMCDVDASYKAFVTEENGKRVMYLQLVKALYGCVRSALLWYDLFKSTLEKMGFKLNPYDPCVANKMINGTQCTLVWYVDDNKISHVDPAVVTTIVEAIESCFGKMTVSRGMEHEFLGMTIIYNGDGTASIDMSRYSKEAIEDFGEDIGRTSATPAAKTLFDIDENSPKLSTEKAELFHSIVAKLLYVSLRARIDIQLPVVFLCTRVAKCTKQDWGKLRRVLQYLKGTINDSLRIGADNLNTLQTWVDASYAVHQDMKSHTGGAVSFGHGALLSKSAKQKLNTKSSTEAELVGASDYLPSTIWVKYFMEAQGYPIETNLYHQDNQSAIKLELNGKKSGGQKSRHIDIRYFFIKDRLEIDNVKVVYCPTEAMLADFFTKPLQGNLFRRLREVIMGRQPVSSLKDFVSSVPHQERVERANYGSDHTGHDNEKPSQVGIINSLNKANDSMKTVASRTYADVLVNKKLVSKG